MNEVTLGYDDYMMTNWYFVLLVQKHHPDLHHGNYYHRQSDQERYRLKVP